MPERTTAVTSTAMPKKLGPGLPEGVRDEWVHRLPSGVRESREGLWEQAWSHRGGWNRTSPDRIGRRTRPDQHQSNLAAAQSSPNVPCDVRSEFARWQVAGQLEQEKGRAGVSNEGPATRGRRDRRR